MIMTSESNFTLDVASQSTSRARTAASSRSTFRIYSPTSPTQTGLQPVENAETKFNRSPGMKKILEMACKKDNEQLTRQHSKFSVDDFLLRKPTVCEDESDEYDTDLETDDAPKTRQAILRDTTGKEVYLEACKYYQVTPTSYFVRNIASPVVNLAHHGLGDNGVKPIVIALLQNTKVCELDLRDNAITDESGKNVAYLFLDNFYISTITLASNNLGIATAKGFSDAFEGNGTLRILSLSNTNLCNKSLEIICRGVVNNYSISELDLSRNKITEDGGKYIGNMLSEQRSLHCLDLSWNGLGQRGTEAVLKGLRDNIVLQTLNLSWNAIGTEGCRAISRAFGYMSVTDLDISSNRLLADGAKILSQGLKQNSSLNSLRVGQNILENTGICYILKAILNNANSSINTMDITGTDLEQGFYDLEQELIQSDKPIKFIHETRLKKSPAKQLTDPRDLLKKFLADNNIHKLDLFDFIDQDASMSVTVEEFRQGLKTANCGLAEFQIQELMDLLDQDHDGEIDYSEFATL